MAIMSEFSSEPNVRLIGSEIRDVCYGRDAIAAHMRLIFDMPLKLEFKWKRRDVAYSGDIAWLFADGEALLHRDDGEVSQAPYRLTGIFEQLGGKWLWRHFHGSEPREDR